MRAGIDLLVVDEAQRLRRPPGHPGEPAWRAVAPIAALGRHVLLLSATPLEDDAHGFFRLLQLLRPDDYPEGIDFEARLARARRWRRAPAPRAAPTSAACRREWACRSILDRRTAAGELRREVETAVRSAAAPNAVARRQKIERVRRALASGAALGAVLGRDDRALRQQAEAMDAGDPRVEWLLAHAPRWRDAREKTLVFVAHRETLEMLRTALSHGAQLATGVFHEDLPSARRDLEVARFREPGGPSLLVSTECGGEGRNFEFCRRLVLFDLPWKPATVEQRIGRLDRIGRRIPVEIVYFRPPAGLGLDVVRLHEAIGLFREPIAASIRSWRQVEARRRAHGAGSGGVAHRRTTSMPCWPRHAPARTRIRDAAYQQLHHDPYRPDMAAGLLARVPRDLDALNEHVVVTACVAPGLRGRAHRAARAASPSSSAPTRWSTACRASRPARHGSARSIARRRWRTRALDFFASGHPLVEGVFAHFEDSPLGRVARFTVEIDAQTGQGLVAIYKDGPRFDVVALDSAGTARPDWEAALRRRPLRARPVSGPAEEDPAWRAAIRRLSARLDPARRPHAVAAIDVQSRRDERTRR